MERQVKGIWIPLEIWQAENLSWNEKILLMEIDSFTSQDMDCFLSNDYIGEMLGVKPDTASKLVSSLIQKGYIRQVRFDGRKRYLASCMEIRCRVGEKFEADYDKNPRQTPTKIMDNNIDNKTKNKQSIFIPPTPKEVAEYAKERGYIDPDGFAQHFVDYYTEAKWHLANGKPMKDWKRAVITWEPGNKYRHFGKPTQGARRPASPDGYNFVEDWK